jgi:hypothetical protein
MSTLRRTSLLVVLAWGLGLGACGSDGETHPQEGNADADVGEPDGGYPEVACTLPLLKKGDTQLGSTTKKIEAKLVSVEPLPLLKGTSTWVLDFTTPDGKPVSDIPVTKADTYMPVHGHTGIYEPTVKALSQPGRLQFTGFNFTMRGPWEVRIQVTSKAVGSDYIIWNTCVEDE